MIKKPVPKRRNAADMTLRNTRASLIRDRHLDDKITLLTRDVETLMARVLALEQRLTAVERINEPLVIP